MALTPALSPGEIVRRWSVANALKLFVETVLSRCSTLDRLMILRWQRAIRCVLINFQEPYHSRSTLTPYRPRKSYFAKNFDDNPFPNFTFWTLKNRHINHQSALTPHIYASTRGSQWTYRQLHYVRDWSCVRFLKHDQLPVLGIIIDGRSATYQAQAGCKTNQIQAAKLLLSRMRFHYEVDGWAGAIWHDVSEPIFAASFPVAY